MATKKLIVGRKVDILKRPTNHENGKIAGIRNSGRGVWYDVQVGTRKEPKLASYRAGDLKAV